MPTSGRVESSRSAPEPGAGLPGHDDQRGGADRPQRDEPGEGLAHGEHEPAGQHGDDAGPAQHHRQRARGGAGRAAPGPAASRRRTPTAGRGCRSTRTPGWSPSRGSRRRARRGRPARRPPRGRRGSASRGGGLSHAPPARISGHRRKTWPWIDRDQKCWSGLARESSRGVVVHRRCSPAASSATYSSDAHAWSSTAAQRDGGSHSHTAARVPRMVTAAAGMQPLEPVQPVPARGPSGRSSSTLRMKDSVSRKAEIMRKTSTPPETRSRKTW